MQTLSELKTELEKVKEAEFYTSMSDNYCYTTGRIYPIMRRRRELEQQIAELEQINTEKNGEVK